MKCNLTLNTSLGNGITLLFASFCQISYYTESDEVKWNGLLPTFYRWLYWGSDLTALGYSIKRFSNPVLIYNMWNSESEHRHLFVGAYFMQNWIKIPSAPRLPSSYVLFLLSLLCKHIFYFSLSFNIF